MTVTAETPVVYWVRGCGNCTRLKGYLTDRGIDFVAVDVHVDEGAVEEMQRAGIRSCPSLRLGDRWVTGNDLVKVNELLGLDADQEVARALTVGELVERAAGFLEADARYALQIPPEHYDDPTPTMRDFKQAFIFLPDGQPYIPHHSSKNLVHHIAGHGEKFKRFFLAGDGVHELGFSMAVIEDFVFGEPDTATPMYRVVGQMRLCAADIQAWEAGAKELDLSKDVETRFGTQSLQRLMQVMVVSMAQHTRQLLSILGDLSIEPDGPINEELFAGLSMASSVWGD